MEQFKKISSFIATLKVAYPKYFNDLQNEDFITMTNMYEDMLCNYNEENLKEAARTIIKTKKYMPSIKEILEVCDETKVYKRNEIIELMIKENYFKDEHEIEKAYMWVEEDNIPNWFKEDMKKYYSSSIANKERILIGN